MEGRSMKKDAITLDILLAGLQAKEPQCLPFEAEDFEHNIREKTVKNKWIIRMLIAAGAWIAATNLLTFLFLFEVFENEMVTMVSGLIIVGISVAYTRLSKPNFVTEPLIMVLNFCGQGLMLASVGILFEDVIVFCVSAFLLQLVIFSITRNHIQKMVSVIVMPLAIVGILWEMEAYVVVGPMLGIIAFFYAYSWSREASIISNMKTKLSYFNAIVYGIPLTLILLNFLGNDDWLMRNVTHYPWMQSMFIIAGILVVLAKGLKEYGMDKQLPAFLIVATLFLAPLAMAPGVLLGLLLIVIGNLRGHLKLLVLGVLTLIYFMVLFYYNLETTLLVKSMLMMASGALLIGARFALKTLTRKS